MSIYKDAHIELVEVYGISNEESIEILDLIETGIMPMFGSGDFVFIREGEDMEGYPNSDIVASMIGYNIFDYVFVNYVGE